jgi:hypothetical protein
MEPGLNPDAYDIKSLKDLELVRMKDSSLKFVLNRPSIVWGSNHPFSKYTVEEYESGRMDLVMDAIYGDSTNFADLDIILYLNGIDNPLAVKGGMEIIYPPLESLDDYRFNQKDDYFEANIVAKRLSVPNKTTKVDSNRQKFVEADYSLPPTVRSNSEPIVSVSNGVIKVGGIG